MHKDIKHIACPQCDFRTKYSKSLNNHLKGVHQKSTEQLSGNLG